jgi:hypothetical protein
MSTIDIDEAIRTYLGSDERGGVVPYGQEERVRAKYGPRATTVLEEVLRVIQADGLLRYHEE